MTDCPCGSVARWCCPCGEARCLACLRAELRDAALASVKPSPPPAPDAMYELVAEVRLGPHGLGVDALCDVMLALQADADTEGWGKLILDQTAPPGTWRFMRVTRQPPSA